MDSLQQRALHKLFHAKSSMMAVIVRFENIHQPTDFAKEELYRALGARDHIDAAIDLLKSGPEVEDEFQIELPWY